MRVITPPNGVKNMNKYIYRAFGLIISSPFEIKGLPRENTSKPDVIIEKSDLSKFEMKKDYVYTGDDIVYFGVDGIAKFYISSGKSIKIDIAPSCVFSKLGLYILGSCMGAVLHQRGYMLLHGSCVTNGKDSILITGDSGVGKSTLAAEFLSHGWKLMTDDVTAVKDIENVPVVRSSYPSQKLWNDSLARYKTENSNIHSLYFDNEREKFSVDVSANFVDTSCKLSMIVRLIKNDSPCSITDMNGMTKTDQLLRNTYRMSMIPISSRERHFRRCVMLADKIPMAVLIRQNGVSCANTLYRLTIEHLGVKNNG